MEKKRYKRDLLLISSLLCLSFMVVLIMLVFREEGGHVVVTVDGDETSRYELSVDGEYELNGGTNILVVENGEAYLRYADCPDKTCVKRGRIKYSGQSIVCLPNKLTVRVIGADSNVDIVS